MTDLHMQRLLLPDEFTIEKAVETFSVQLIQYAAAQDDEDSEIILTFDREGIMHVAAMILHLVKQNKNQNPS